MLLHYLPSETLRGSRSFVVKEERGHPPLCDTLGTVHNMKLLAVCRDEGSRQGMVHSIMLVGIQGHARPPLE